MKDNIHDWQYDRLKDVAAINVHALPANTDPDYEFEYLEISNVGYQGIVDPNAIERLRYEDAPSRARRRVTVNCTLISSVRPNLQAVAFVGNDRNDFICSTGFNVVQPIEHKLSPKFLYYTLISENARQYFEAAAKGVGYPAIDDKDFNSFNVPLHTLPAQYRIASFLDASCVSIDAALASKRQQVEVLKTLHRTTITNALTKGLSSKARLKPSGQHWLGSIPEHWNAICLKRLLIEPLTYGLNEAAEFEDYDLPRYIRITDFDDNGGLRDDTFKSLPREIAQEAMLETNDVLFARSGATVGKTFIFRNYTKQACFAGYLVRARTIPWKLSPLFLYYFTKTTTYEAWKNIIFTQATIQNISASKYNYLTIPVPSIAEQNEICAFIEYNNNEFERLSGILRNQIETLVAYRKSLIHECVTGQHRICEADLNRVKAYA